MQVMMMPVLPQTTWQHCTRPLEAADYQIPEEGVQEAGTHTDCCSPPHACGTVQCEKVNTAINIVAARMTYVDKD